MDKLPVYDRNRDFRNILSGTVETPNINYTPSLPNQNGTGTGQGTPTAADIFNQVFSNIKETTAQNNPWVNSVQYSSPYQRTTLHGTERYDSPVYGYDPFNPNLEYQYGDRQGTLTKWKNNLIKFGANTIGTFAESLLTIPLALDAISKNDMSIMYNNSITNAITDWTEGLETSLPNYETTYGKNHPVLNWIPFLGNTGDSWGGLLKNLGFTAGAIGGALVQDAVIGSLTGGIGEAPLIEPQIARIFGKMGKIFSSKGGALKLSEAVANGTNAVDAVNATVSTIKNIDRFRYGLSLITSAMSEASFEANNVYKDIQKQLSEDFYKTHGRTPNDQEVKQITDYSVGGGNADFFLNTGLLTLTNSITFGSLLRPYGAAEKVASDVLQGTKFTAKGINEVEANAAKTATSKFGKAFKILSTPSRLVTTNLVEGFEEGSQFLIQRSAEDFYRRKFDQPSMDDVDNLSKSIGVGLKDTLTSREGLENIFLGILSGAVIHGGKLALERVQGIQNNKSALIASTLSQLNSTRLGGDVLQSKYDEAVTAYSISEDMKKAAQSGNIFEYKNLQFQQLFNWIRAGVKTGRFDLRMDQLRQLTELSDDEFKKTFGIDPTGENRKTAQEYVAAIANKSQQIKQNIENVDKLFKNPFKRKTADTMEYFNYLAHEDYKNQLALDISDIENNKKRITDLKADINKISPLVDAQKIINLTHDKGIEQTIEDLRERLKSINDSVDILKSDKTSPAYRDAVSEYNFLTKKISDLQRHLKNNNLDVQEASELMTYWAHGVKADPADHINQLDAYNMLNLGIDGARLASNLNHTLYSYQSLLKKGGYEEYFDRAASEYIKQAANNASAINPGNPVVKDPEVDEIDKNGNVVKPAQEAQKAKQEATKPKPNLKNKEIEQAKKNWEGKKQELDKLKENPKAKPEEITAKEVEVKKAEQKLADTEEPKMSGPDSISTTDVFIPGLDDGKDFEAAQAKKAAEEAKKNVRTNEIYGGANISPQYYLNGLHSENFPDLAEHDNLQEAIKNNTPEQLVNKATVVIEPKTKGKKAGSLSHIRGTKLYRQSPAFDMYVVIDGKKVGRLHPSDSLYFEREGEKVPLSEIKIEEYQSVIGNNLDSYGTFMDEIKSYQDTIRPIEQAYKDGKKEFSNDEVKSALTLIPSYGGITFTYSDNSSTLVQDIEHTGTSAVASFPVLYSSETGAFERTTNPTILNDSELSTEDKASLDQYIEANSESIQNLNSRYIYFTKRPDGKWVHIVARPSELNEEDVNGLITKTKELSQVPTAEKAKQLNLKLRDQIYIGDSQNRKGQGTSIFLSMDKDGNVYVNFFNGRLDTVINKRIRLADFSKVENIDQLIELINRKYQEKSVNDPQLRKLGIKLDKKDVKSAIKDDDKTTMKELGGKLKVSAPKGIFTNGKLFVMPVGTKTQVNEPAATPKPQSSPKPKNLNRKDEVLYNVIVNNQKDIKGVWSSAIAEAIEEGKYQEVVDTIRDKVAENAQEARNSFGEAITRHTVKDAGGRFLTDKKSVQTAMEEVFGLPKDQAKAVAEIYSRVAKTWAKRTGKTVEDFYNHLIVMKGQTDRLPTSILNQIIGEKGVSNYNKEALNSLDEAKNLEKNKVSSEDIYIKTGWERGVDKKWRYDLPTNNYTLTSDVQTLIGRKPSELFGSNYKLNDLIHYPELFKAYPFLKGVTVKVGFPSNKKALAITKAYLTGKKQIGIVDIVLSPEVFEKNNKEFLKLLNKYSEGQEDFIKRILTHEIQHVIQYLEGFVVNTGQVKNTFNLSDNNYNKLAWETEANNAEVRNLFPDDLKKTIPISLTEEFARGEQLYPNIGNDYTVLHQLDSSDSAVQIIRSGNFVQNVFTTVDKVARERFDISKMDRISSQGSDRDVYDMGDGKVLKVAKSARGLRQNSFEGDPDLTKAGIIPQIYERGLNYVVVEKVTPLEKFSDNEKLERMVTAFHMLDRQILKNEDDPEAMYGFHDSMTDILKRYGFGAAVNKDILWGDFKSNPSNWGTRADGSLVHLDAGTFAGTDLIIDYMNKEDMDDQDFRRVFQLSKQAAITFSDSLDDVKDLLYQKDEEYDAKNPLDMSSFMFNATFGKPSIEQVNREVTPGVDSIPLNVDFTEGIANDRNADLRSGAPEYLNQKARAAIQISQDGRAVIYALTNPNVSSPLHELAHFFDTELTDDEALEVRKWAEQPIGELNNKHIHGFTTETREKFARGFEKYLSEGSAPSKALQSIFDKFKEWLTNIYKGIIGSDIDVELNDEMRKIYAKMLGSDFKEKVQKEVKEEQKKEEEVKPPLIQETPAQLHKAVVEDEQDSQYQPVEAEEEPVPVEEEKKPLIESVFEDAGVSEPAPEGLNEEEVKELNKLNGSLEKEGGLLEQRDDLISGTVEGQEAILNSAKQVLETATAEARRQYASLENKDDYEGENDYIFKNTALQRKAVKEEEKTLAEINKDGDEDIKHELEKVNKKIAQINQRIEELNKKAVIKPGSKVEYNGKEVTVGEVHGNFASINDGTGGEKMVSFKELKSVLEEAQPETGYLPYDEADFPSDKHIVDEEYEIQEGKMAVLNGEPVEVKKIETKAKTRKEGATIQHYKRDAVDISKIPESDRKEGKTIHLDGQTVTIVKLDEKKAYIEIPAGTQRVEYSELRPLKDGGTIKEGKTAYYGGKTVKVMKIEEATLSSQQYATVEKSDGTETTVQVESLKPMVEPEEEDNSLVTMLGVKRILNNLQSRFNIPYKLVLDDGNWKGRFFKGTVYINMNNVDRTTPFHEYLHPFLAALKVDNSNLYTSLVTQLKEESEGLTLLRKVGEDPFYKDKSEEDKTDEALVRYISQLAAQNVNREGKKVNIPSVSERMQKFVQKFIDWVTKIWKSLGALRGGTELHPMNLKEVSVQDRKKWIEQRRGIGNKISHNTATEQEKQWYEDNANGPVSFLKIDSKNFSGVSLQDVADLVSLTDAAFDLSAHAEMLKMMDEFHRDSEYMDEWVQSKLKRLRGRLQTLADTAKRRVGSQTLGADVMYASRALSDDNDIRALVNFVDTGIRSLNWANTEFSQISKNLYEDRGNVSQEDINASAKQLEVVKNIISYYLDDVNSIIHKLRDEFDTDEIDNFNDVIVRSQNAVADMKTRSIEIITEWMWPNVDNLNQRLIAGGHEDRIIKKEDFRKLLYQADSDIDRLFFLLGSVGSSQDIVSSTVRDVLYDVVESNKFFDADLSGNIKNTYGEWLKEKNLQNDRNVITNYFKKNFLRKVRNWETIEYKKNDDGTTEPVKGYVERWAFHQPYFFDKWREEFDAFVETLGPRPTIYDRKNYELWESKRTKWMEENGTPEKPATKFFNPAFQELHGKDQLFTLLYNAYIQGNGEIVEDEKLLFGIIPQVSLGKNLFSDLKFTSAKGLLNKARGSATRLFDFFVPAADEKQYSPYEENLDGSTHRSIRVPYNRMLNEQDLDFALPETILKFSSSRNLTKLMRIIEPNVRILKSVLEGVPSFKIEARKVKATGAKGKTLWNRLGRKLPLSKENTQAFVNKQLINFINHAFYGEGEIPSILELSGRSIDLNKWGNNMAFLTALMNMVGNVTAGVSNVAIGNIQSFGESIGAKYYDPKDWRESLGEYAKNIPEFIADCFRLKKSIITQLAIHYDAIQGEFRDKYGKKFVGNIAQKYATRDTLFVTMHGGEHQIQLQGMLSLMRGTTVKLTNGETINLRDAYTLNDKGFLKLREDAIWTEQDEKNFTKKLHGLNQLLNGNYSTFDKAYIQNTWYGKLALIYRKYLYNGFRMRWGGNRVDMQLGDVTMGYYNQFFRKLGSDIVDYKNHLISKQPLDKKAWTPDEKYAAAKTIYELSLLVGITLIGVALGGGSDKKKKQEPWLTSYMTLLLLRARRDVGTYSMFSIQDITNMIQNPTAISPTLTRFGQLFTQLAVDPFETYKRKTGYFEKGESVSKAKLYKTIPVLRQFINTMQPKEQQQFYNLLNKNF